MRRIRKAIYIVSLVALLSACSFPPTGTNHIATLTPVGLDSATSTMNSISLSLTSPIGLTQVATVMPTPSSKVIDKTNVERLALLRQWDVENLAYSYDSANFWFSDSNQFLVPMIGSPSMVGLQSFAVDSSTPLWFIPSLQVDFTINEHDEVMLNLEGIKAFNKQGEEIQTIRTN